MSWFWILCRDKAIAFDGSVGGWGVDGSVGGWGVDALVSGWGVDGSSISGSAHLFCFFLNRGSSWDSLSSLWSCPVCSGWSFLKVKDWDQEYSSWGPRGRRCRWTRNKFGDGKWDHYNWCWWRLNKFGNRKWDKCWWCRVCPRFGWRIVWGDSWRRSTHCQCRNWMTRRQGHWNTNPQQYSKLVIFWGAETRCIAQLFESSGNLDLKKLAMS